MTEQAARVVVGVDGSMKDTRAVDWAADEAAQLGAGLHILYAARFSASGYGYGLRQLNLEKLGEEATAPAAERVRGRHPELQVSTQVVLEEPSIALVEASRTAAIVVVGARGLGRIAGRLLGSVSQKVAAHAHGPVAVVRDAASAPDGPVVVGVDPGDTVPEVLVYAFEHARRRRRPVRIVHAFPLHTDPVAQAVEIREALHMAAEELAEETVRIAEEWSKRYPDVPVEVREQRRHPVDALTDEAATASLLVVGSRGRRGLTGLRLGSVAQGVLHEAPVVVVVRVAP